MSALHLLTQAAPMATMATAAIHRELTRLKQLAESPEHAILLEPVSRLMALCDGVQRTVSDGVHALSTTGESLQGLLDLLHHAEEAPLPAHRLAGLLAPLQQQVQRASTDIGQLL
jgi:hypothetical protein